VRQHPIQAKISSLSERTGDRKVVDPVVIGILLLILVELNIHDEAEESGNSDSSHFLYNPFLFAYATLLDATTMQEVRFLGDGSTRSLTGSIASCIYHLKDPEKNNAFGAFFVFPDIAIRKDGIFCLQISLYKIYGHFYY
jgi:hypothetical protein